MPERNRSDARVGSGYYGGGRGGWDAGGLMTKRFGFFRTAIRSPALTPRPGT